MDRFHEARSIHVDEWLADEVVKELVSDLASWPPPVSAWRDPAARERFEPLLDGQCPRPSDAIYRAAFQLARWELERAFDALDDFARNDRAAKVTALALERLALTFLHGWLTDVLLEVGEAARLKRPKLLELLARVEKRVVSPLA